MNLMRGVLDTDLLEGPLEINTRLRPHRYASPISSSSLEQLEDRVIEHCQFWAGSAWPLLPVNEFESIPDLYRELLKRGAIDYVRGNVVANLPWRVRQGQTWAVPLVYPLSSQGKEEYRNPVEVVELDPNDPWRAIYLVSLGWLPERPNADIINRYDLRPELQYNDTIAISRVSATGSIEDLVSRLESREAFSPRQANTFFLASGLRPDTSFLGPDTVMPDATAIRRAAGPNIIVVVGENSVEDLALCWNLRAAHGEHNVMPIGVPESSLSNDLISYLQEPGRAAMFGLGGGRVHVTSWSISVGELSTRVSHPSAVIAEPSDLLTFGPAPGRPGSQVTFWTNGRSSVVPINDGDRDVLRTVLGAFRVGSLILDVEVDDHPLPLDQSLRGSRFGSNFRAGAAQITVSELRRREAVDVAWPSGWTALSAAARTRGLSVQPSREGAAALALIRSIGGIDQVRWLLHEPLIDVLYRIAERGGMSWWKNRWKAASQDLKRLGVHEDRIIEVAARHGRDDPAVAPPNEGRDEPFEAFKNALGGKSEAATNWVLWAERKHLLVRGATVICSDCGAQSWLPVASLPPPVICPACGRRIDQPYRPDLLRFRYRLGETLRRSFEYDCFGHVLALHWAATLFGSPSLVGAHPGVTFSDRESDTAVGEADVALLFRDGSLLPIEVKRRASGVDSAAIQKLDSLSEALGAPWDAVAVTQRAHVCADAAAARRPGANRPRFLLTYSQMLDPIPIRALGVDPFEWAEDDTEIRSRQSDSFLTSLREGGLDAPYDHVSESLMSDFDED